MIEKIKQKWGLKTNFELFVIFVVFSITGSLSAFLSKPLCRFLQLTPETLSFWFTPIRLLLIFPIYQILLVLVGYLFGQFPFFWQFEKKMLQKLGLGFLFKK